jgi:hypothetical protein
VWFKREVLVTKKSNRRQVTVLSTTRGFRLGQGKEKTRAKSKLEEGFNDALTDLEQTLGVFNLAENGTIYGYQDMDV